MYFVWCSSHKNSIAEIQYVANTPAAPSLNKWNSDNFHVIETYSYDSYQLAI